MWSVKENKKERVLLVGVVRSSKERWDGVDSLEELASLTRTAGGEVVERFLQIREKPDPKYFIGKGKLSFLKSLVNELDIDLVIFDNSLTPAQIRNLEQVLNARVIDRTALILDIFAIHARTAEAKAQVELAQLTYRLSHLIGKGEELSRLGGGIGTRGPGEKKLEVDRRRILHSIKILKERLKEIEKERSIRRARRRKILRVSLAGYTNAGKSSLFNILTNSKVGVSSRLFSTLDPTTRVFEIEKNIPVCITDTVGFIKNLPLQLVASFRATLAEITDSDLILHVADASHPKREDRIEIVKKQLEELGAKEIPTILVLNKEDLIIEKKVKERLKRKYPDAVFVSALYKTGINELKERIKKYLLPYIEEKEFRIPESRQDIIHVIYEAGCVVEQRRDDGEVILKVKGYRPFITSIEKEIYEAV